MASLAQVRHDIASTEAVIEMRKRVPEAELRYPLIRVEKYESRLAALRKLEQELCQPPTIMSRLKRLSVNVFKTILFKR